MNPAASEDPPVLISTTLFGELGRALSYHALLIILTGIGTVLITYGAFQFVSDQYVSTARLLVKLGRENVELPVTVEKGGLLSTGVRKEDINSEVQLIQSRPIVEAAVDRLGVEAFLLEPPPPKTWFQRIKAEVRALVREVRATVKEWMILLNLKTRLSEREEAVLLVMKTLTVEREKDSDVIAVSSKLPSPDLATKVVDTLVGLYLERRLEVRRDRGMSDFFEEQLSALRQRLSTLESDRLRLRDQRGLSALGEERALLMTRLQGLYAQLADDERELRLLGGAGSGGASVGRGTPSPTVTELSSFPNLEQLRGKITQLRVRRGELLQKFTPRAEQVVAVDREVADLEVTLRQAIQAQSDERRRQAESIERRLQQLNGGEAALESISRDHFAAAQNYQAYARRREEARVSEELDLRRVSNIALLAPADRPLEPASPRKLLITALSFPFGLLAGLGIALLLEYLNTTIRDERDLGIRDRERFLGWLRIGAR